MQTNAGVLFGVGIGPGDPDLLTLKAVKVLAKADVIYVPKSKEQASTALQIVLQHLNEGVEIQPIEFSMSKDLEKRIESRKASASIIETRLKQGQNVVFLTLGDPMLYSTYSYILEYLNGDYSVETIPGIYSFSAISSLLNIPLCKGDDSLMVISKLEESNYARMEIADTVVCMKVSSYADVLYNYLQQNSQYRFVMISEAGKSEESIYRSAEILKEKLPYFSTAIIQKIKN